MSSESILRKLIPLLKLLVWIGLIIGLIALTKYANIHEPLTSSLDWIASLGPWGPITFIGIYILSTIFLIPGSILTLGAGALFGIIWGAIYVSVGATIGAAVAFLIGRYLARGWVEQRIKTNPKFEAIDRAVAREGWKIIMLARLSPIFPFNLLNYASSLTQVSFKDYFVATWIGITPGTILYVYLGSLASSLAMLGTEQQTHTPVEWAFYGVGLVAAIAVTIYITRIAREALAQRS